MEFMDVSQPTRRDREMLPDNLKRWNIFKEWIITSVFLQNISWVLFYDFLRLYRQLDAVLVIFYDDVKVSVFRNGSIARINAANYQFVKEGAVSVLYSSFNN